MKNGASVEIRGLSSTSQVQVQCGAATGAVAALQIRDSILTAAGAGADARTQLDVTRCSLELERVDIVFNNSSTTLGTSDDATVSADQVHVRGNGTSAFVIAGARQSIRFTNSLLDDVQLVTFTSDNASPGSKLEFAFNTFVQRSVNSRHQLCSGTTVANRSVLFENTISAPLGAFDAFQSPNPANCTFVSTILGRQASPPSGTTVVDPMFVDVANRDYHLAPSSSAIDAAADVSIDVDHDLDGTSRPVGAKPDVGAYEQ